MAEDAGRKVKGGATIVRRGDPGSQSDKGKGKGKLEFVAPDGSGATPEQVAAVERAGGKVKAPAKASAKPAAE